MFGSKIQPNVKTESKDNEEEGKGQIEELVLIGTDGALTILVSLSLLQKEMKRERKDILRNLPSCCSRTRE